MASISNDLLKKVLLTEAREKNLQVRFNMECFIQCKSNGAPTIAKIYWMSYHFQEKCDSFPPTKIPHSFSIMSVPEYQSKTLEVSIICHSHTETEDSPEKRSLRDFFQNLCPRTLSSQELFPKENEEEKEEHTIKFVSDHIFREWSARCKESSENLSSIENLHKKVSAQEIGAYACFVHMYYQTSLLSQPPVYIADEQFLIYLIPTEPSETTLKTSWIHLPNGPIHSEDDNIITSFGPTFDSTSLQKIHEQIRYILHSPNTTLGQKVAPPQDLVARLQDLDFMSVPTP